MGGWTEKGERRDGKMNKRHIRVKPPRTAVSKNRCLEQGHLAK